MQTSNLYLLLSVLLMVSIAGCSSPGTLAATPTPSTPAPTMTPTSPPQPALETIEGTFENQIKSLERNMPRSGSGAYVIPSLQEQANFAKLVSLIQRGEPESAIPLAAENYYSLIYYVDKGDDFATNYLLREQRPIQKGWGLYAFRLDSTSNIIVEAPHPLYDKYTPSIALDIYRALDARALLIAGAHRKSNKDGSADVAHAPESIFQSVHQSLTEEIQGNAGPAIFLQIHGFHTSKHEGYPEVVFGLGKNAQTNEVALARRIKDALSEQGITAGICTGMESELQDLCAETNIQSSITKKGIFLHIEVDEKLRKDDTAFVTALVQVFGQ